jgi:hypothetical protein
MTLMDLEIMLHSIAQRLALTTSQETELWELLAEAYEIGLQEGREETADREQPDPA